MDAASPLRRHYFELVLADGRNVDRLPRRAAAGAGTASGPDGRRPPPTSSCTPTPPSPSSTAPRPRPSWPPPPPTLGYPALALTDHDGVWGSMEFAHACRGLGVRPITGAELTVALGDATGRARPPDPAGRDRRRLPQPLPAAHRRPLPHPRRHRSARAGQPWVTLEQVEEHAEGLVCLSGCARDGALAGRLGARRTAARRAALGRRLLEAFGRERFRVELQRPYWRHDRARNRWLAGLAERLGVPCVATGNVHSHDRSPRPPAGRLRRGPAGRRRWRSPSRCGAATAARRSPRPRAMARALRRAPRGGRRDRCGSPSGCASTSPRELGYRYPGAEDAGADRELAEALPGAARPSATRARPRRREAEAPARGGAGDDPPPRPLRLLPPPPRPARAGPRGRGRGARPGLGPRGAAAGAGARLQRQLDRLLPDRPLPRRPGQGRPLRRPLPQRRDRRRCPTSTSTSRATSARC